MDIRFKPVGHSMDDAERKKWDKFHLRPDVIMYRSKAQLARNEHVQSKVAFYERKLMDLAFALGVSKTLGYDN